MINCSELPQSDVLDERAHLLEEWGAQAEALERALLETHPFIHGAPNGVHNSFAFGRMD